MLNFEITLIMIYLYNKNQGYKRSVSKTDYNFLSAENAVQGKIRSIPGKSSFIEQNASKCP